MSIAVIIIIAVLLALLAALLIISGYVLKNAFGRRPNDCEAGSVPRRYRSWTDAYKEGWSYFQKLKKTEYELHSRDGLLLRAVYIPAIGEAERTIVFAHGYRDTAAEDIVPQLLYLRQNSCAVFLITQRAHDMSAGKWVSFGIRESEDLADWLRFAAGLPEIKGRPIYAMGVSMGGAAVMRLPEEKEKLPEELVGLISDSGFADPRQELIYTARHHLHIPAFPIISVIGLYTRIICGFSLHVRSARDILRENEDLPMLIIHGSGDRVVPASQSVRAYLACRAPKMFCLIDGAPHICGIYADPEKYQTAILSFFAGIEGWEETEEVFDDEEDGDVPEISG